MRNTIVLAAVAGLAWMGFKVWQKRQADLAQTEQSHALLQQQYREGWGYGD